jgi:putative inorganic carbon (hco3(-)) transporter
MSSIPSTLRRRTPIAPERRPAPVALPPQHGAAFGMFLLVNAFLFVRPSDIYAPLLGVEIYQYVIGLCLLLSLPALIELISGDRLGSTPVAACVLGLFPIIFASSLLNLGPEEAVGHAVIFAKILTYFLLLLALVTTPGRLKVFVAFLVFFAGIMATLSLLDFYEVIELIRPKEIDGLPVLFERNRMNGPGLYGDPNDLCTVLATMLILAVGLLTDSRSGSPRFLWLIPVGLLAVGVPLTQSRGGLIALMAGAGVFVRLRFGWGRAIALGALGLPLLLLFALRGRQVDLSTKAETATQRIQLWSSALVMFKAQPVLGGGYDQFAKEGRLLAHNTYLQWFAELGFFGGALFLGATMLSLYGLYGLVLPRRDPGKLVPITPTLVDPTLRHYHPYVAGAVMAYFVGMCTLSLNYLVSTYTIVGLPAVFLAMSTTDPPRVASRFGLELLFRLAIVSVLFLAAMFVFVRITF